MATFITFLGTHREMNFCFLFRYNVICYCSQFSVRFMMKSSSLITPFIHLYIHLISRVRSNPKQMKNYEHNCMTDAS